ncbi:ketopantoate reductase family protein [Halospeciosus flavus]|uniref:2-dehydropantoate 2-reductase n=1 Tax=Halospeciosus flavus TaxID=3032283 RepID=A0ABD5Z4E8_9EURY|nr:2-dehydropantoate 2-reductase [Halospeciosus flavus]
MHVAVLGPGALGCLFAAHLADAGTDVTLVGRPGEHLAALREDGLRFTDREGETRTLDVAATADPATVAPVDVVLVTVKSYATADALTDAEALLDGAAVCTFQNGLGNAETVAEFVPEGDVLAGTTTHGATRERAGHVRHAGTGETTVGRYFALTDERTRDLAARLTEAGIETSVTDDPRSAVWQKVLVNLGINAQTALARVENGALVDSNPGERLLERAVREGAAVARADGRDVDTETAVERARRVAHETASNRSSMRQDVEADRRTEVEALYGEVARRSLELGIETPVVSTLADLVRLTETGYDRR